MNSRKTLLIATSNRGKSAEIQKIFEGTEFDLKFLFDFPEETKDLKIIENAKTFEGNALIKAIIAGELLKLPTLADDSGLCIKALDDRPGVYSARYSGIGTDEANIAKVLEEMRDIPTVERDCHYHATVAFYDPSTKFVDTVSGIWEGRIANGPRGNKSFGYAPIFLAKEFGYEKTNAELDPEDTISINHRGKAFAQAIEILRSKLRNE